MQFAEIEKSCNVPLITVYTQNYNKSEWIAACIESVLKQSYDNFEYIICDHGSQDESLKIIMNYADKDNRIRVFTKENSERGFIPELILKEGKGKYFVMLDSDDCLASDNLEKLVDFAEENSLDIACCGSYAFNGEGQVSILRTPGRQFIYDIEDFGRYFIETYPFLRTIWGKIIRRELIQMADFDVYKKNAQHYVAEDTAFVLAVYEKSKRIGLLNENLLFYRMNNNSVSERYNKKHIEDNGNVYYLAKKIVGELQDMKAENIDYIENVFWASVREGLGLLIKSSWPVEKKVEEIKFICQDSLVSKLAVEQPKAIYYMNELIEWIGENTRNLDTYTKCDIENFVEIIKFIQSMPEV